ncbi:MAG: PH domain-containing protein [Pseudomonadales bacterium]|nr:PH domain-containing protein [Pseudomonadales bacterium]
MKDSAWQRLSPWAMLYFIVRVFKGGLDPNALFLLAPLYGFYQFINEWEHAKYFLGALIFSAIVLHAIVSYLFFKYSLDDSRILISSGILFKRRIDIPCSHIQDIRIEKPLYFKPLGLVSASIDTAGSNEKEAVLAALTAEQAQTIRAWALSNDAPTRTKATETATHRLSETSIDETEQQILLLTRSNYDLIVHGISNNRIWIILAALLPFIDRALERAVDSIVAYSSIEINQLAEQPFPMVVIYISAAIIIFVSFILSLSIIGSFINFYNFRLTRTNDSLRRESGLMSRHQVSLKISRVQSIAIKQGLIDRCFKRYNLFFHQFSSHDNQQLSQTFLIPSIKPSEVDKMTQQAFRDFHLFSSETTLSTLLPISKKYIRQQTLLWSIPVLLIFIFLTENFSTSAFIYFPWMLSALLIINYLRWKKWGYRQRDDYLIIRKGFLGTQLHIFPKYKTQQITINQSLPMIYSNYCNIHFILGLNRIKLPYISLTQGISLTDNCLYDIESSDRSWM